MAQEDRATGVFAAPELCNTETHANFGIHCVSTPAFDVFSCYVMVCDCLMAWIPVQCSNGVSCHGCSRPCMLFSSLRSGWI